MEQMNPGQVKKYIKQLRKRHEEYVYYMGQLVYSLGEQGKIEDPELLDAFNALKEIKSQIAQWEGTLEQIKAAKEAAQKPKCPYCQAALPKGAAFCAACGTSLVAPPVAYPASVPTAAPGAVPPTAASGAVPPTAAPGAVPSTAATVAPPVPPAQPAPPVPTAQTVAPPTAAKVCAGCGAALDEDALFCAVCGAKVEEASQLPPAAADVSEAGEAPPEESPPTGETVVCPNCKLESSDTEMRFCPECGTKIRE